MLNIHNAYVIVNIVTQHLINILSYNKHKQIIFIIYNVVINKI